MDGWMAGDGWGDRVVVGREENTRLDTTLAKAGISDSDFPPDRHTHTHARAHTQHGEKNTDKNTLQPKIVLVPLENGGEK